MKAKRALASESLPHNRALDSLYRAIEASPAPCELLLNRRELLGGALASSLFFSAFAAGRQPEPRPAELPRVRQSFDFDWKFLKGDPTGAEAIAFPDVSWKTLDLPHDWSIEGPFGKDEPTGGPGGYLPTGIGWYRKQFRVPASARSRKIAIEFDGVYQNSEVWINGHYLGRRPYGYITFAYDLTPFLKPGNNVLAVRVDNSHQSNSRWYSGSGIYRHTWLLLTDPLHIAQWGTFVTTPHIAEKAAVIRMQTRVRNDCPTGRSARLRSDIVDPAGQIVATVETSQDLPNGNGYEFVQEVELSNPSLWSIDTPRLYKWKSTLRDRDSVLDEYETPFGIREARFDADRGFLLNGQPVKLKGVCVHHEAGPVGAAVPERVWERRFEILKEMGCNAIRTSHNPAAPEFLDLCDSMGFLVMNEAFDEWRVGKGQIGPYGYAHYFDEWHERDVIDFLHRDRNHPCVVIWSAGNEIPDQTAPDGVETCRELVTLFHREDPTRPVTAACDQISAEPKAAPEAFLDSLDVVGYNYPDRWRDRREKSYSIDRHAHPQRRFICTESSGMGSIRGDYAWLFPETVTGSSGFAFEPRSNAQLDSEELWKFTRTYDYVSGDFMWTGIDYLGEARWPSRSSSAGVLDTCGFKKDAFYFYQSQWTQSPVLHLFPHWNWSGREGQFVPVLCYTNCDTVELFLNGKSVAIKGFEFPRLGMEKKYGTYPDRAKVRRTTNDLHLAWDVPYEPGTLRAVGSNDGHPVIETQVSTTGAAVAIVAAPDRDRIRNDRRDVVHITAQLLDEQGRIVPDAANEIAFEVTGQGRLIGLDSGDPQSHEDFKASRRKAFHGSCLAIVQSTGTAGRIQVVASAAGLKPHTVTLAAGSV